MVFIVKLTQEGSEYGRLPRTDLAGQFYEAGMVVDAVEKMCKGLPVVFAEKNEAGVGGNGKRLFLEAIKGTIHGYLLVVVRIGVRWQLDFFHP